MFFIVAFLTAGGVYVVADYLAAGIIMALAAAYIITPIVMAFMWIDERTGIDALMVHSFQFLSGVQTSGEVIVSCPGPEQNKAAFLLALLQLPLAFVILLVGFAAIIALPSGVIASILGGLHSLATHSTDGIRKGSGILGIGLGSVIICGLVFRLIHILSSLGCS